MLKFFMFDEYCVDVLGIDLKKLWDAGKRVILTDLDNTLVGSDVADPTDEARRFLAEAKEIGFKVYIVSNNHRIRVERFARDLDVDGAHYLACKPFRSKVRKVLSGYDVGECVFIGDQLMTDVFVAKRLDLHAILVKPVNFKGDGGFTKVNRWLERRVVRGLRRRGLPVPGHME